jgi:hypothetical protein
LTPDELRRQADEKDRAGQAALDRGEATEAAVLFHQAEIRRLAAVKLEAMAGKVLPSPVKARTFHTMQPQENRGLAISAGHLSPDNDLKQAARAKGYSLAQLAAAVKKRKGTCSSALLTMAYKGERPMPERTADIIAELIDFPKDRWRHLS